MELVGHHPSTVHGTAHWGPPGPTSQSAGNSRDIGAKFSEEFHVFSIIWKQDRIEWYVDDVQYHALNKGTLGALYPFNAPFFFIFNVAVGGNWPGNPDGTTVFPQRMIVDYIRVFQ